MHGRSLLTLATGKNAVDIGAVCVLARCIIEIYNAAIYFLEPRLSPHEAHMRLHLFLLNHSTDLARINERLGMPERNEWAIGFRAWSVSELKGNPVFAALDELHQKNLLRGKWPYAHNRYSGQRLLASEVESGLYTLFSQSTHSFSIAIPGTSGGQATPAGRENSLLLAADASALYLSSFGLHYWKLRNRAIKKFLADERQLLEEQARPERLLARLKEIKGRGALL